MDARIDWDVAAADGLVEEVWLLGQPPLHRYLNFVQDKVVGGADLARSALLDEWRAANDRYYELEAQEAGLADQVEIRELDQALQPLVDELVKDARFRRSFDTLPTRFAMVELDRVVVSQPH